MSDLTVQLQVQSKMSFLDVLESIGTAQRVAAPMAQQNSAAVSKPPHSLSNKTTTKLNATVSPQPSNKTSTVPSGMKRKVEEAFTAVSGRPSQSSQKQGTSFGMLERKVPVKISSQAAPGNSSTRIGSPAPTTTSSKIHPRGSYLALMAEAKAAQEQRAKSEVGIIKHQATSKVRVSKSERRKQEEGEKSMRVKLGKQPQHNSKVEKNARIGPKQRPESSYKGTAKPAPLMSSYKGTAGLPSQHRPSSADARHKAGQKPSRYDEYLGTDEEDEEGDVREMGDGYDSEASSDMEADAFDVEEEESRALREARADDARELALENKLKREKEERRRKLEVLARKQR